MHVLSESIKQPKHVLLKSPLDLGSDPQALINLRLPRVEKGSQK